MGGRGDKRQWILPTVYDEERELAPEVKERMEALNTKKASGETLTPEDEKEIKELAEALKNAPPKGNVFELQSKGWRRRGWLTDAFPAIGKGAVLESDWMPCGNNLFSRRAINRVDFIAYQLGGTEDLHCTHERLKPAGLRMCVIPHCLSHHVQRLKDKEGKEKYLIYYMYHEEAGECVGHLRHRNINWHSFVE